MDEKTPQLPFSGFSDFAAYDVRGLVCNTVIPFLFSAGYKNLCYIGRSSDLSRFLIPSHLAYIKTVVNFQKPCSQLRTGTHSSGNCCRLPVSLPEFEWLVLRGTAFPFHPITGTNDEQMYGIILELDF